MRTDLDDFAQDRALVCAIRPTLAVTFNTMAQLPKWKVEKMVRRTLQYAGDKLGYHILREGFFEVASGNAHIHSVVDVPPATHSRFTKLVQRKWKKLIVAEHMPAGEASPQLRQLQEQMVLEAQFSVTSRNRRPHVYVDAYKSSVPRYIAKGGNRADIG